MCGSANRRLLATSLLRRIGVNTVFRFEFCCRQLIETRICVAGDCTAAIDVSRVALLLCRGAIMKWRCYPRSVTLAAYAGFRSFVLKTPISLPFISLRR